MTALELHGVEADAEEVECMVANMIYRVCTSSLRFVLADDDVARVL